jgi:hypothetical protein
MIQTRGVWTNSDLEQVKTVIEDEIQIKISQGKTTGLYRYFTDTPGIGNNTTFRVWDTVQDAEEWINFVNSLGVVPVFYEIV